MSKESRKWGKWENETVAEHLTSTMTHGSVYELTIDIVNPKPDRRRKSDFFAREKLPAGARLMYINHPTDNFRFGAFKRVGGRGYDQLSRHHNEELYDKIIRHLKPVSDLQAFLHRMDTLHSISADAILEQFVIEQKALMLVSESAVLARLETLALAAKERFEREWEEEERRERKANIEEKEDE